MTYDRLSPPTEMKVNTCRFCLALDVKVSKLGNTDEKNFMQNILQQNGYKQKLCETHHLCYECQALLAKSYNFIQRVLKAQSILYKLMKNNDVSVASLKQIERQESGISTSLKTHILKNIDILGTNARKENNDLLTLRSDDYNIVKSELESVEIEIHSPNGELESADNVNITDNDLIIKDEIDIDETHYIHSDNEVEFIADTTTDNDLGIKDEIVYEPSFEISNDPLKNEPTYDVEIIKEDTKQNSPTVEERNVTNKVPIKYKKPNDPLKNEPTDDVKIIKEDKKQNSPTVEEENVTNKVPKKYKRSILLPSKFILSLSNISDRRHRRNNIRNTSGKEDSPETSDSDNEKSKSDFIPSSEYSSDSSYDMFDKRGRRLKQPKKKELEYPRQCDDCNYEVPEKRLHFRHYLFSHPKKPYPYQKKGEEYVCHICSYKTFKRHAYYQHKMTHGTQSEMCWKCSKTFYNNKHLQQHIRSTHKEANLECDYCGKLFKMRTDIVRHIRTHTGEKPFKCHLCDARFAHSGNVIAHFRTNHQERKIKKRKIKPSKSIKSKRIRTKKVKESSDDDSDLNLLQLKKKKNK